uniref:Fe2OG dioxygenase domain-containing protein n=1 Tax=Populus alba TaxID=43335 RepID=A0A4U5PYM6_POPAL|nr:hypothetical protein D5086_0000166280 [Populus alba]
MSSPANLLLADLASSGVKQIPTSYIRPISDRPNLSDVQISDVPIPLIDLHGLNGPNHSLIIKQISQACGNDGFFQVKNHGIPEEMIGNVMNIARQFFNLPASERLKSYSDDPTKNTRRDVAEYCTSIRGLVLKLLEAISESLGLERDYIDEKLGKHGQHMAMNYYPPCPQPELTNGKWIAVNPIPNTFIINIGDQMQVLSNDRYKSVLHRAVVNCNKERISIPTFYCPSKDAVIAPPKELIDDDHPAVYRDFTYGEYYERFWNRGLQFLRRDLFGEAMKIFGYGSNHLWAKIREGRSMKSFVGDAHDDSERDYEWRKGWWTVYHIS